MKKIAAFGVVFFIILSQTFADEHSVDSKNMYFSWQLFQKYKLEKQRADFSNLDPVSITFNDYFLMKILENTGQNNNKNVLLTNSNSQEPEFSLLGATLFYTGLIFSSIYLYNSPQRYFYNNTNILEQQNEMVRIYQMLYPGDVKVHY
jgi:hypothetical protein